MTFISGIYRLDLSMLVNLPSSLAPRMGWLSSILRWFNHMSYILSHVGHQQPTGMSGSWNCSWNKNRYMQRGYGWGVEGGTTHVAGSVACIRIRTRLLRGGTM